jgi:hypothetical protein
VARSRMAWVAGVALGALVLAYAACTAPPSNADKLHLAAATADFRALGIDQQIAVREDGRRTPQSSDYFEWWYFHGLLDDGTVVVVWFGDNWLYGTHKRAVDIELTSPGKPTRHIMRTFDALGMFASDYADIRIGPHGFKGDLQDYAIHVVDAGETGGSVSDRAIEIG